MGLVPAFNWLKTPSNHQIIARWTLGGADASHALELPPPPDPDRFELLAIGDTGDSDPESPRVSAQDAVALELAADARLPGGPGAGCAVLHTGDVVYMTGERRLYDRNFRRPYAPFMTPESTFERLVFRLPFLPVPGNHDYYDFAAWAAALVRIPVLGHGLRAAARELFAFSLPQGGSGMGRAYMDAFVDQGRREGAPPRPYRPSEWTRIPNRYYSFRLGSVDVFALDSNTLDAPPPGPEAEALKSDAARGERGLRERAAALDRELAEAEASLERVRQAARARAAAEPAARAAVAAAERDVVIALEALVGALRVADAQVPGGVRGAAAVDGACHRLEAVVHRFETAADAGAARAALEALAGASLPVHVAMREVEEALVRLPEGRARTAVLEAHLGVDAARERARRLRDGEPPTELAERMRALSEEALDVQRLLASARTRRAFRPDDHDAAQLRWLERELDASVRERPDAWRIVYLHHPPYTTLTSYCEHPELCGIRENLLPLIRDRVHVVLGGHAHAFEWIRSAAAPGIAFVVSGGGGQVGLRRSVVEPSRIDRHRQRYERLRAAGVIECAVAGRGPAAADGDPGRLHHYVRFEVTPEAMIVRPIGVRRARGGWRRETPMPAWHAEAMPDGDPPWRARLLEGIEVRRGRPPRALWGTEPR